MKYLNIGCGTHRAPEPWLNIDVVRRADVNPDLVVTPSRPLPILDNSIDKIFAGHVLEHMPWPETKGFLEDLRRVLKPGGELLVVGPDVLRAIERYKVDLEPFWLVRQVIEYHDANPGFEVSDWPNARHWWNCWSARLAEVMQQAGFKEVSELPQPDQIYEFGMGDGSDWPAVGYAPWQCAVHALA